MDYDHTMRECGVGGCDRVTLTTQEHNSEILTEHCHLITETPEKDPYGRNTKEDYLNENSRFKMYDL